MGQGGPAQAGAPDGSEPAGDEGDDVGNEEPPSVARDDLNQFSGAESHPSEPVRPPVRDPDSQ
jgi:hypothetical protein